MDSQRYLWDRLAGETLPVVLYGMGDGADKILAQCARHGIAVSAVFASDAFVRGQTYRGYPVMTLRQVEETLGDFVVLLCFATERPEVLRQIQQVARRHTLLAPDVPVCGDTLITPDFLTQHAGEIHALEGLLADELSRHVLWDVLSYKLTGEPGYLWRCESPRDEVYQHVLHLADDEVFVDAGAYTGDTVEEFVQRADGRYRRIVAAEPDRRNYQKLCRRVERLGLQNAHCHQVAVWSGRDRLPFDHRSGRQAALATGGDPAAAVDADSIDRLLDGQEATLILYDVEGAEEQALLGSAETIRRYRPRLAVAAYHRGDDILRIPRLLHQLRPDYRLYLRHHPYLPAWETNCYAV